VTENELKSRLIFEGVRVVAVGLGDFPAKLGETAKEATGLKA
jgi:hypothetical protein